MSLFSIVKSWFKENQKPIAQKCTGYIPNERAGLLDNFNRYVQQNHGYKRMHLQEYMYFYNKAKEDVQKAYVIGQEGLTNYRLNYGR